MVPPTTPVLKLLDRIERSEGNPRVIRSQKPGAHLPDLAYYWGRIRDRAGLEGVRIHDLHHHHASETLALGESLTMIGKLLGHAKVQTTARYAHLVRNSVKVPAVRISDNLEADMDTPLDVSANP